MLCADGMDARQKENIVYMFFIEKLLLVSAAGCRVRLECRSSSWRLCRKWV